ncbi:MAG: DUF3426 domain-containing protein [Thiobacillaceae bacterium]
MLTTCPECHTCFRVSQAQLDQRRGLVRCGRCSAVFNAYDTLLPELTTPVPDEAVSRPAVTGLPDTAVTSQAEDTERSPLSPDGDRTAKTHASDGDRFLAAWPRAPVETTTAPATIAGPAAVVPERAASPSETPEDILLTALPTARKRTLPGWRSTLWLLASLLLTATFLLQTAYFLRAEIAAAWPETRPILEQACRTIGCSLPLDRDLSALRFDASSLETDPEDGSRAVLRVLLSNRSDRIVAWPHLILILTDVRDMPVAQRPFSPTEYLSNKDLESRGMAPGEEREVRLDLELKGLSAYGYKLDKQYP